MTVSVAIVVLMFLFLVGDQGSRGKNHTCHAAGVFQSYSRHFCRVQDPLFQQISEVVMKGILSITSRLIAFDFAQHHRAVPPSVLGYDVQRLLQRLVQYGGRHLLVRGKIDVV